MVQQINKKLPNDYILAVRILWAPVGLMILCWVFVPESPWHLARRGEKEKALKSMRQLYGNVDGYDFEEEYNIIAQTIKQEKETLEDEPKFLHLVKGANLVCVFEYCRGKNWANLWSETYSYGYVVCCQWSVWWYLHNQYLLNLYV
jgi:hypothetical protein